MRRSVNGSSQRGQSPAAGSALQAARQAARGGSVKASAAREPAPPPTSARRPPSRGAYTASRVKASACDASPRQEAFAAEIVTRRDVNSEARCGLSKEDLPLRARHAANSLTEMSRIAGEGTLDELKNTSADIFDFSFVSDWNQMAPLCGVAAAKSAASSVVQVMQDGAHSLPREAASILTQAIAAKPETPLSLLDEMASSAMCTDQQALAALWNTVLVAVSKVHKQWESDETATGAHRFAMPAVVNALVQLEIDRLRASQEETEIKWTATKQEVGERRILFMNEGFKHKAACCVELARQAEAGLRGLVVDRASRSANKGLRDLDESCQSLSSYLGVTLHVSSLPHLSLVGKARADAELRVDGFRKVVQREIQDLRYWAVRGQLPDGEVAPCIASQENDLWIQAGEDRVVQELMASLGPLDSDTDEQLEDRAVTAIRRLGVLSGQAGAAKEVAEKFRSRLAEMVGAGRGEVAAAHEACEAAGAPLKALVQLLVSAEEGLLEVLDASSDTDAVEAAHRWTTIWLSSAAWLTNIAEPILELGPRLALAELPTSVASRQELLHKLLLPLRTFAALAADPSLRMNTVMLQSTSQS